MIAEFLGWSAEAWTAIGTLALAIATVVAVFFAERLRRWVTQTQLTTSVVMEPPDVHMIELLTLDPQRNIVGRKQVLWLRMRVSNAIKVAAEAAEVSVLDVWRIRPNGNREHLTTFLPLPLLWSHFGAMNIVIPRGLFRHVDLGYLEENELGKTQLVVTTIVQPTGVGTDATSPNLLAAGTYEFEIMVTAANAKPMKERWKLTFPETWSSDEAAMTGAVSMVRA